MVCFYVMWTSLRYIADTSVVNDVDDSNYDEGYLVWELWFILKRL